MIRFRRIYDPTAALDRPVFEKAGPLFWAAFPQEPEAFARIERLMAKRATLDFEPVLLVSEDRRGEITGLAFLFFFPETRFGYLQYIASDPGRPARGIGGALYDAVRETLLAKRARGLLLDVSPVDADKVDDKASLPVNRKRLRFYERYGARIVDGTAWDTDPNPRNAYHLTQLLFDPLGRAPRLRRAEARQGVRRILQAQYGYEPGDPFVERVTESFRDDPVRLRPARTKKAAPPPPRSQRIKPIKLIVAEGHEIHHLKERGYVERPVRVRQILKGMETLPVERVPRKHFPHRCITAIHDPRLVNYLKAVSGRLGPKAIVYPEVFPIRRPDRAPQALEDRAGYFCADTFTPLTSNVWAAARQAVDVALTAADLVLHGERFAYALCRPPGHHAERRIYGGFCFLNNSAAAASLLAADGKVALLDIDYHHGNGAQDIFYSRADVLTVSIHGHPRHAYPNFSGYADERGEGVGLGFNRNIPLEPPVDDARYLKVLDEALRAIRRFRPRYLVLSLGFDIMGGDPTGSFQISLDGLRRIAERIGALGLPTVVVQEGGYALRNLRVGAHGFFTALAASWFDS